MSPVSPSVEPLLCVGQIMGPHGLQGHVKVKSFTQDPATLFSFPVLYDVQKKISFQFEKKHAQSLPEAGQFITRLTGIFSRTKAEGLKGTQLFIERAALAPLVEEETFYHADLVGLRVVDQAGNERGVVQEVPNFGAGDLLHLSKNGASTWIPFTRAWVPEVNIPEGFVRVDVAQMALFEEEK